MASSIPFAKLRVLGTVNSTGEKVLRSTNSGGNNCSALMDGVTPNTPSYRLIRAPDIDDSSVDGELFISGNRVVWSIGQRVQKSFTLQSTVLQALWCSFPTLDGKGAVECLCVLLAELVTVYASTGQVYTIPLPCKDGKMFPLSCGLLIHRSSGDTSQNNPVLFTVRHPLEDLGAVELGLPLSEKSFDQGDSSFPALKEYVTNRNMEILGVWPWVGPSSSSPLCTQGLILTFCSITHVIDVWSLIETQNTTSQYVLRHAHSLPLANNPSIPPSRVYLTSLDPASNNALLYICHPQLGGIQVFSVVPSSVDSTPMVEFAFHLPGNTLLPIGSGCRTEYDATRDMLVLDDQGVIKIYHEKIPFVVCSLEQYNVGKVVDIRDNVHHHLTVATDSGQNLRVEVPFVGSSPLVQLCMQTILDAMVGESIGLLLRGQLTQLFGENMEIEREWASLHRFLCHASSVCGSAGKSSESVEPNTAWAHLLTSAYHKSSGCAKRLQKSFPLKNVGVSSCNNHEHECSSLDDGPLKLKPHDVAAIITALHALYEDLKLNTLQRQMLEPLGRLLYSLCSHYECKDYCDHYLRDFPDLATVLFTVTSDKNFQGSLRESLLPVADIYAALTSRMCSTASIYGAKLPPPMTKRGSILETSRKILRFYDVLFCGSAGDDAGVLSLNASGNFRMEEADTTIGSLDVSMTSAADQEWGQPSALLPSESKSPLMKSPTITQQQQQQQQQQAMDSYNRLIAAMIAEDFKKQDVECLPFSVAVPIREALACLRSNPPQRLSAEGYKLIGREDLGMPLTSIDTMFPTENDTKIATQSWDEKSEKAVKSGGGMNGDGTVMNDQLSMLRFAKDNRLTEVGRLLSSVRPCRIRSSAIREDLGDHERVAAIQHRLWILAQGTLARCVGRGLFTYGTAYPLPTEPLPIPPLQLAGKVPPSQGLVKLDLSVLNQHHDVTLWPEFHNGVAAALRLAAGQTNITRTWIVYNKPMSATHAHAGFLMGLGLLGHLQALAMTDVYTYLAQDHEPTKIAVMLGMAAAARGTMDNSVFKMLFVHIPSLHPISFPDLEVAPTVQAAALLSLGLLYQGTANRRMAEILISEIGKRGCEKADRESCGLAAGCGLGLVMLAAGDAEASVADLQLQTRLLRYMNGGKVATATKAAHGSSMSGAMSTNNSDSQSSSSRLREGDMINLDVTSPAATIALGLMFMRTNNAPLANRIQIPDTHFLLQSIRPDFVLLRIVAKSLIMWDHVLPTHQWVENQIPPIVNKYLAILKVRSERAATAAATTNTNTNTNTTNSGNNEEEEEDDLVDMDGIRHVHINILVGCCLSLGLRYAGTSDQRAYDILIHYLAYFRKLQSQIGNKTMPKLEKYLIESSIDTTAVALGMLMAGTGHVETLKILRSLVIIGDGESDLASNIGYGNHMARSVAIGMLFMSGGRATFSNSDSAIALLLISCYPRWPLDSNDNRYHLQPFRHLAALAASHRCLQTRHVHTNTPCSVPVEITLKETNEHSASVIKGMTPVLLPHLHMISCIKVTGSRYWPTTIEVDESDAIQKCLGRGAVLYVQRKAGYLPYTVDPIGCRGLMSRSFYFTSSSSSSSSSSPSLSEYFNADPKILAFAQEMCGSLYSSSKSEAEKSQALNSDLSAAILFECLTADKGEMLNSYVALALLPTRLANRDTLSIRDLRFLLDYYDLGNHKQQQKIGTATTTTTTNNNNNNNQSLNTPSLISTSFLGGIHVRIEEALRQLDIEKQLEEYLTNGFHLAQASSSSSTTSSSGSASSHMLAAYLLLRSVPLPSVNERLVGAVRSMQSTLKQCPSLALPLCKVVATEAHTQGIFTVAPYFIKIQS